MSNSTTTRPRIIAAKFAGRCTKCNDRIAMGDRVAWTKGVKGVECALCANIPAENPWKAKHLAGEMDFTGDGYSRSMARRLVEHEFAGAPDPIPCGCGGQAHYRATVGAMQCPSCRSLFDMNGEAI